VDPSSPAPAPPERKAPLYKNPYLIGFLVGVVFLTVLPFLQRGFLRAPPPGPSLGAWQLQTLDGTPFGAEQLKGTVWIVSLAPDPARQQSFGAMSRHLADLGDKVKLVSLVVPGAAVPPVTPPSWVAVTGSAEALDPLVMQLLRPAFAEFAHVDGGSTLDEYSRVPALGLVDQDGHLRGYWKDDELGRGNVINAARLLGRYGARP